MNSPADLKAAALSFPRRFRELIEHAPDPLRAESVIAVHASTAAMQLSAAAQALHDIRLHDGTPIRPAEAAVSEDFARAIDRLSLESSALADAIDRVEPFEWRRTGVDRTGVKHNAVETVDTFVQAAAAELRRAEHETANL